MAFEKPQSNTQQRERFYLDNLADLAEIKSFEKELAPYLKKSASLFGKILKGFELYLHENGMCVYSTKHREGAVIFNKLEEYRLADMKYRALTELWDRRRQAEEKENERIQRLIPDLAMA